jgi:hypothetical protein
MYKYIRSKKWSGVMGFSRSVVVSSIETQESLQEGKGWCGEPRKPESLVRELRSEC